DGFGNLKQVDVTTGNLGIDQHQFSESYVYDDLHRLKSNSVNGHEITHYSYDSVGNLLFKSDYATEYDYTTGTTGGPNAVKRVYRSGSWKTFSYDARGNMIKGDGLSHAIYNAMDKPIQLIKEGKTLNFTYGPQHMRFKQVNGSVTTFYSDKLYEEDIDGTKTTWRAYIDDIAVISQTTDETASIRYTHRDRLQSARIITDYNGYVSTQRNYDPFGKPRLASGGLMPVGNAKLNDLADAKTRRGFTDHEHLDDIELIHMNGRVYDYNLGRFMSVDPLIQSPTNSQSINPYSYIMNNPLAGIDPTGYCSTDDTLKDCARGLEERKVQAITDSNGRTVGQIGKDSQGIIHITNNGSSAGKAAIADVIKAADIGSSSTIAKRTGGVGGKSEASQIIANSGIDFEAEKEAIDNGDGLSEPTGEMMASRGRGRGRTNVDAMQSYVNARYNFLFEQIRTLDPTFNVARPNRPTNRADIQFLEQTLQGMRGAPPINLTPIGAGRNGAFREAKRRMGIPVSQQPSRVTPNFDRRGVPQPGETYWFRVPNGIGGFRETFIRRDAAGHFYSPGNIQNRGPHFNDAREGHYDY
uniref:RHS repeat-associated core domain-containing protein n=1 Tax=Pseudoalteromonas arabiensis TaxID=874454 RepID=UPI000A6272E7